MILRGERSWCVSGWAVAMAGGVVVNSGGGKDYPGKLTMFVLLACIVAATGGIVFGYDIGISGTPRVPQLVFFLFMIPFSSGFLGRDERERERVFLCISHAALFFRIGYFLGRSVLSGGDPTHDFTHTNKTAIFPLVFFFPFHRFSC